MAADYAAQGYDVDLRGGTSDWGIDIIAARRRERLGIQVKMYRGSRPVNRRQVFELYGAARYFDCTSAVMATDGVLDPDAAAAAAKLGIAVWRPTGPASSLVGASGRAAQSSVAAPSLPSFEQLWEARVMPLAGQTLAFDSGQTNRITSVDWGGVHRTTSTGRRNKIPIEPFIWAIQRVRERGYVTRAEINEQFEGRYSSGVTLILAQIPELELQPTTTTIRARGSRGPKSGMSRG